MRETSNFDADKILGLRRDAEEKRRLPEPKYGVLMFNSGKEHVVPDNDCILWMCRLRLGFILEDVLDSYYFRELPLSEFLLLVGLKGLSISDFTVRIRRFEMAFRLYEMRMFTTAVKINAEL